MNNEICVPAAAVSLDGENGGAAVAPGGGDEVEFTGKGKVTRAEGGNVYIAPTEINGQPIAASAETPSTDNEGAELDEEVAGMNRGGMGGGMGMMLAILALFLFGTMGASAQKATEFARARTCTRTSVSNHVAYATPTQLFSVEIDNHSGATLYLMVFDSATNQLVNALPHFTAVPVATGTVGWKDWGAAGAPMNYGVNVCLSTTPYSLTNASSGGVVTLVHSPAR